MLKLSQLRAIFAKIKLAKRGLLAPGAPSRNLSRLSIKLGGVNIPLSISQSANKSTDMHFFRSGAIKSYFKSIPIQHLKKANLKGIYVLDDREFAGVISGIGKRTSGPEAMEIFGKYVVMQKKASKSFQLLAVHNNGRIFFNLSGFKRYVDSHSDISRIERVAWAKELAKTQALHEFGHNLDNPKAKLTVGGTVPTGSFEKSFSPEFLKLVGIPLSDIEGGIAQARTTAIEAFASYYAFYGTNPRAMRLAVPTAYDYMRKFFSS